MVLSWSIYNSVNVQKSRLPNEEPGRPRPRTTRVRIATCDAEQTAMCDGARSRTSRTKSACALEPELPEPIFEAAKVAEFGAQDVEIARAPIDIARSVGRDGDPGGATSSRTAKGVAIKGELGARLPCLRIASPH
jgi:hypothetical protein